MNLAADKMKHTAPILFIISVLLVASPWARAQLTDDQANLFLQQCKAGDAQSIETVRKNAAKEDVVAQFFMGVMYDSGRCIPKDYAEAVKWFRKAADQGYARAQNNLGVMYVNGRGVPQDDAEAEKWYRMAAEQGYAGAQLNLGILYANGRSLVSDLSREAHSGVMSTGNRSVPQDYVEAAKWYRRAAEQRDAGAQFNLGVAYATGRGVPKDDSEAAYWYRKAAEQGNAGAQFNLGARYANGRGVPQDDVQAYKWWTLAKAISSPGSNVYESANKNMELLANKMPAAQIARAQQEAAAWTAGH
jgi:TPR repeat protein